MTTRKTTTSAPALTQPDTKRIEKEASSVVSQAKGIAVKDEESYRKGSAIIDAGNGILKQVAETFDPLVANAHKLHKDLLATKKQFTDPIENALRIIKRQMSDWQMQLERERRAKEAELAEQARKESLEQAQREALVLEGQGEAEAAEETIQTALEAPAPAITLPAFNSSEFGRTTRSVWKWKIIDVTKIPMQFFVVVKNASTGLDQDISTAAIGSLVRTLKNKELAEAQFGGGVEVWQDFTLI